MTYYLFAIIILSYTKIKHTMIDEKKKSLLILNGLKHIRKILTDLKVFLNVTPEQHDMPDLKIDGSKH